MIKRLLLVIFGKFAKSHSRQIAKAQKWIDSAQEKFAIAIEEAEIAESKFNEVIKSKKEEVSKTLKELDEANDKLKEAESFKNKIKDLVEE